MELEDLVGMHELSGVDRGSTKGGYCDEDCETIAFVLDGITYIAQEDPSDGYRSAMKEITVSSLEIKNRFNPQRVLCRMKDESQCESYDVLEIIDIETGKVVLSVGTGNNDDYYPYWVAEFTPENMACNQTITAPSSVTDL